MAKRLLPLALALLFILSACGAVEEPLTFTQIDAATAADMMQNEENYIILDVRTHEEFAAGHIPGAICIPNETITSPPDALPEKDALILIYCRSGNRSKQAAEKLVSFGYSNVYEFGGIIDWQGEIVSGE